MIDTADNYDIVAEEHWTTKKVDDGDIRLFVFRKKLNTTKPARGAILFVHGSSMASTPTFDLHVNGRPFSSVMDWFSVKGFDTWCVDMEGYGRSDKNRDITFDISNGADDLAAASEYITKACGTDKFLVYGISSGALRAAKFAERFPERVARLALDAFVWTGEGSPTLAERKKKLTQFMEQKRRPIDLEFVRSIFSRDHPDTADAAVVEAFADAICALDDSIPNGTYIDMCSNLPVIDPAKLIVPTIIMRGEYDGIAGMQDLIDFYQALGTADRQFAVMPGISHASFQQKNYLMVYDILLGFYTRRDPDYTG